MTTYRLAVLGDPVEHSRSPEIHTAMLTMTGLSGTYEKVRADSDGLAKLVRELQEGEWSGFNVTMPLKADAARLADDLDPSASRSGSVNTLARNGDRIVGYSTDTTAFRALLQLPEFEGCQSVLVLGAGGSAAAALAGIGDREVYVAARRVERAAALTEQMSGDVVKWGAAVAGALVINTTPIGMNGEQLPTGILEVAGGLIDLPYGGEATPAITTANRIGLPARDGHEFLIRQAVDSFRLWTGADVDLEALFRRLRNT